MPQTALSECGLIAKERFDVEKNLDCGAFYFAKPSRKTNLYNRFKPS